jgi:hypothetical protein
VAAAKDTKIESDPLEESVASYMYRFRGGSVPSATSVNEDPNVSLTELAKPEPPTAIATTITSPAVTELANVIAEGEQYVVAQPPLFC